MFDSIEEAIKAFRKGTPVLIYDRADRENEIDIVVHSSYVDVDTIFELRTIGGGLICVAIPMYAARAMKLKFFREYVASSPELRDLTSKRLRYGDEPAFSIWVNHRDVATGIKDFDRALTIRRLWELVRLAYEGRTFEARVRFYEEFVAPGHVPILIGRDIELRQGHTELSLALSALSGMIPCTTIVEMLSRGSSASLKEARRIADELGYPLISSEQIVYGVRTHEDMYRRYNLRESRHGIHSGGGT